MSRPLDIGGLLRRGGVMSPAEAEQLAHELTEGKLAELAAGTSQRSTGQPVKVIPFADRPPAFVSGYFTQEKFILGKTPEEMESILGIFGKLRRGAHVLQFVEPLKPADFENRAYTYLPQGLPYEPKPEERVFLPGSGAPQWRLTREVQVSCIATLKPGQPYHR